MHGREGALDTTVNWNRESGQCVIGVLGSVSVLLDLIAETKLTIIAWMPEFTKTNIQIGGDMNLIPAHMHIIAPAW